METTTLLYWITRLDSIGIFFTVLGVFAGISVIICIITWAANASSSYGEDDAIACAKKVLKRSLLVAIPALLIAVFTPSTKDAYIICGLGNTIDYIKSNDTAKQLPDKAILALDKLFDEINEPKSTKTK